MKMYDNKHKSYSLDEFIGTDLWIKVYGGNYWYLNIDRIDNNGETFYLIPAKLIDEYNDVYLDFEPNNLLITQGVGECLLYYLCNRRRGHLKDFYDVVTPMEVLTTDEIYDALDIVKDRCVYYDDEYEDEE